MAFLEPTIVEQRVFGQVRQLVLHSPELARGARAGQYLLVRCAPPGSADPLLRRALFVAGSDAAQGLLHLVYLPDERGLDWLAAQPAAAVLDVFGPLGTPFALDQSTRNLLLVGAGAALPALVLLAHEAVRRNVSVVLLATAAAADRLPPAFLLPPDVEYQTEVDDSAAGPLHLLSGDQILWADQMCVALADAALPDLVNTVQATKLRWQRGFAQVVLAGAMPCGVGACQACLIETRYGLKTRCKDGPVLDLRDFR